jgi:succinoglycan biosynthesis transport protein ExoP
VRQNVNTTSSEPPGPIPDALTGAPSDFSPLAIWAAIRKSWLLVAAIVATVGIGVTFFTLGQTKIYEAGATVMFDPQQPRPLGDRVQTVVDTGQGFWTNKEYYRTQYWIIQSQRLSSEVVRALGLNRDPAFLANAPDGATLPPRQVSIEDAASVLQGRIIVEPVKESRLAIVKYQDADPQRARRIVSALVETYVQRNLDDMNEATSTSADWLRGQIGSLKDDLESSELRLHEYKKDKNILSMSMNEQSNMLRGEMKMLSDALTSVRTQREAVRARRQELSKVTPEDPMNVPASELMQSGMLQNLRTTYVTIEQQIESMRGLGKGDNHPDLRAALSRLEATKEAFFDEVKNIRGAMDRDLAEIDAQAGGLRKLFNEAEARAFDVNLLEIEYNRLARARDNNEKLYALVMERSKESDMTRTLVFNNIRIMERPMLPRGPVSPNVPLNIGGGLLAGLVLGLAAAIGREQLDRSVKTPSQLEQLLGLSFLGLLPSLPDAEEKSDGRVGGGPRIDAPVINRELVVHEHPTSGIAEAARAIRTNILFMSPDRPYRTLLVTSAGPAEGKTTVACCIAIAMAQAGRRVVLLDCDMRRPRLHKVFGYSRDVGLTTALIDEPRIEELAMDTRVPNLSVITTGPLPPNPAEILHSEAFAALISKLKDRYDCVVIDSPPVVPVTDAAILSNAVDGTILVVRAFETSKDLARRAARALRDVGGHVVGTVLNAVDLNRHEYGYKYYYYYKREGYAAEEPQDSAAS